MTFEEILNSINADIVANGQNEITADVLRPVLVSLLGFTADQVGDLEDLETTAQANAVEAINEVRGMLTSPTQSSLPPVPVIEAQATFTLVRNQNRAVINVGQAGGASVSVVIPQQGGGGIATAIPIDIGMYFDVFQNDETFPPIISLAQNVVVYTEADDSLDFTGIHSGLRLIKIEANLWRAVRLTRNGGAFREAVTGSLLPGTESDKYTNGKLGIGEENPAVELDVKGQSTTSYTHSDGTKVFMHAGNRALSDIGVPPGLTKLGVIEMRSHPDFPTGQVYTFAGDAESITGFKFVAGSGIADLTPGSQDASRVLAFTDNLDVTEKHAQLRALTADGFHAGIDSTNKDETTGLPQSEITVSSPVKRSDIKHTPFGFNIQTGRLDLGDYADPFPIEQGYDHGDGNLIGSPVKVLAIDSAGQVQTADAFFETKITLLQGTLLNLHNTLQLVPSPGPGKYIVPLSGFLIYNFVTSGYDDTYDIQFELGGVALGSGIGTDPWEIDSVNSFSTSVDIEMNKNRLYAPNSAMTLRSLDPIVFGDGTVDLFIRYKIVG